MRVPAALWFVCVTITRYDWTIASFFFFNDTATTEIYTLSLHDALPISRRGIRTDPRRDGDARRLQPRRVDRKSTRLNSSHDQSSYAVFCLKKKKRASRRLQHCCCGAGPRRGSPAGSAP